jgi:NAD(P)-dependent dehydrogenase (short-subunit alcohol dehydrogenase family)
MTVAVVTGASRGAGRGIAIALGAHGCTVYVTGRSETEADSSLGGTIHDTAAAVDAVGGRGIAVRVDHGDDEAVRALFARVEAEQGRCDILVNNAALIRDELMAPLRFWEKPLATADLFEVGLRSSYVASHLAAPMMVARGRGLILFTSASGAVHYVYGPVYGAHKAGLDKMAADMGLDLQGTGVAACSIWMGALRTERLLAMIDADRERLGGLLAIAETPEFTGHVAWALYNDPDLAPLNGRTLIGAEAARRYGIVDEGGRQPPSCRELHGIAPPPRHAHVVR